LAFPWSALWVAGRHSGGKTIGRRAHLDFRAIHHTDSFARDLATAFAWRCNDVERPQEEQQRRPRSTFPSSFPPPRSNEERRDFLVELCLDPSHFSTGRRIARNIEVLVPAARGKNEARRRTGRAHVRCTARSKRTEPRLPGSAEERGDPTTLQPSVQGSCSSSKQGEQVEGGPAAACASVKNTYLSVEPARQSWRTTTRTS
jgi:hypothetical protein